MSISGLNEFVFQLRQLPEEFADEAGRIVVNTANEVAQQLVANYPIGSYGRSRRRRRGGRDIGSFAITPGNLRRGVKVEVTDHSRFGVRAYVRSTAKHAYIFEYGTEIRHTRTGANRGAMRGAPNKPAPDNQRLVPLAMAARAKMTKQLIEVLKRAGFTVTWTPDVKVAA